MLSLGFTLTSNGIEKVFVFTNKWQNIPPSSVYERHAVIAGHVEDNDRSNEFEDGMKAQMC